MRRSTGSAFDARWKYAAGGLSFDYPSFVHTVLVDMRARLRASEHPDRIFEVVLETAKQAGLVGRRRVLDSTSLYDAVATMDTVTLIRSAIRGLLAACAGRLGAELRGLLARDDDYASAGKPVCDYEDRQAREAMIDALAKDAHALLVALDGRELPDGVKQAGGVARGRGRAGPRRGRGWRVPDRQAGREGPDHLDRRPGRAARPQDQRTRV